MEKREDFQERNLRSSFYAIKFRQNWLFITSHFSSQWGGRKRLGPQPPLPADGRSREGEENQAG